MDDSQFLQAQALLEKYNQEHLLCLYDELLEEEKSLLVNQILSLDFEEILNLYANSMHNNKDFQISPLEHFEKDKFSQKEIEYYTKIGEQELKNNTFAIVTMAGGQGSRLGYKGPKGTYLLDLKPRKSLFEIMCDDIKSVNSKYGILLPWYIMTSEDNDLATKNFFENNNYFDYPKEKITFFTQGKLPIISALSSLAGIISQVRRGPPLRDALPR